MKKIVSLFLTAVFAALAFAQNDLQPIVVVKYNKSEIITLRQLKTRVAFIQKQYGMTDAFPMDQKEALLENMINEKLLLQAAAKENVTVADSQVDNSFLASFSQQLGRQVTENELSQIIHQQSGKTLEEYIKEMSGMSLSEYKAYLKNQLIIQQYVAMKKQSEIQAVAATDEEIRNAYEMNKSNFRWDDMMKLFLVMVPKGNAATEARAKCQDMRNKYVKDTKQSVAFIQDPNNGKSFQAGELLIAKTAQQAQMLRWPEDKLLELFSRKEAFVSEVTETLSDFQFYAVLKKYDSKFLSLSDVVQPETTITVYDYVKGNLTQQKQMQYFTTAAQDMAKELNTSSNVDRKKTGDALTKLLNW